eukprot:gene9903-10223_t
MAAAGAGGLEPFCAPSPLQAALPQPDPAASALRGPVRPPELARIVGGSNTTSTEWATLLRSVARAGAKHTASKTFVHEGSDPERNLEVYTLAMSTDTLGLAHLAPFNATPPGGTGPPAAVALVPAQRELRAGHGDGGWLCAAGTAALHALHLVDGAAVLLPPAVERRELTAFPRDGDAAVGLPGELRDLMRRVRGVLRDAAKRADGNAWSRNTPIALVIVGGNGHPLGEPECEALLRR